MPDVSLDFTTFSTARDPICNTVTFHKMPRDATEHYVATAPEPRSVVPVCFQVRVNRRQFPALLGRVAAKLELGEAAVEAALGHQLGVGSGLHDRPMVQHEDTVGLEHGRQPVCDN